MAQMSIFYVHAGMVLLGFLFIAAGFVMAGFYRHRRLWLRYHKTAGITGSLCFLAGMAAAIVMVSQSGEEHLGVFHAWLGMVTIFLIVVTPALGQLQFMLRFRIQQIRTMHRWFGRMTLFMSLLTILSGLKTAGII